MAATTTSISIYDNIHQNKGNKTVPLDLFLTDVKEGRWQDQVLKVRTIQDHDTRQNEKKKLPYVTISGYFGKERAAAQLSKHTGFIGMDIDNIGNELNGTKVLLSKDPYVYSIFMSVSGTGLCVIFKIDPEKHLEAFLGIADYLLKNYQIVVDPSGKDVSRARFVSYDPDLYINEDAPTFKKYLPKQKKRKIVSTIFVKSEFDNVVNEMVKNNVSCVDDYRDWLAIGFGLADHFGEGGRSYFHQLSSCSDKYEQSICDRQFTHCLRSNGSTGKVTIATIYWFAKSAGINIYTEKTKKIASITTTQKKAGISAEQIAANLEKFEGISKQDANDIINQAFLSNTNFGAGDSLVESIRAYVRHQLQLRRNAITRKIEFEGNPIDDIKLNTFYLDAKIIQPELTFELFTKVVFSDNTPTYHPLKEWFDFHSEHQFNGNPITEIFSTIRTSEDAIYWGKKWLVSVVASAFGQHSPLMLILAGEKQGTGKTEFFRRLLPSELRQYYAESKLDAGKDDEILMTQKWVIMDDEMGGKSKRESKRLKELTSKQTFTLREPYGRTNVDLERLAVLCGTTNDLEILNDPTGNRRLLPIQVESIDFEAYNSVNKTDLLAQAYKLYKDGFEWQVSRQDAEEMATKNDKFEEQTIERMLIQKCFILPSPASYATDLTSSDILSKLEVHTKQRLSLKRVGMELKALGFKQRICKKSTGFQRLWEVEEISHLHQNTQNQEMPF